MKNVSILVFLIICCCVLGLKSGESKSRPQQHEKIAISRIKNPTIREVIGYCYEKGERPEHFGLFAELPLKQRVVILGERKKGEAPAVGYSLEGFEGVVGTIDYGDGHVESYSTADPEQSATIAEIISTYYDVLKK